MPGCRQPGVKTDDLLRTILCLPWHCGGGRLSALSAHMACLYLTLGHGHARFSSSSQTRKQLPDFTPELPCVRLAGHPPVRHAHHVIWAIRPCQAWWCRCGAQKDELERAMAASLKEAEIERQRAEAEEQQLGQAAALERRFGESPVLKEVGLGTA